MKKLHDLASLYEATIQEPENITKEEALKIIRELIYLVDDHSAEVSDTVEEINEILQTEEF